MRRTAAGMVTGTLVLLAAVAAARAAGSEPVFVNCQHTLSGPVYRSAFDAREHPSNCDIWGVPEDLADLFMLRDGRWTDWGTQTATVTGKSLNTHPGQGGPPSTPVTARLHRIRRGCLGLRFYTRASFSGGRAKTLVLSAACKPTYWGSR